MFGMESNRPVRIDFKNNNKNYNKTQFVFFFCLISVPVPAFSAQICHFIAFIILLHLFGIHAVLLLWLILLLMLRCCYCDRLFQRFSSVQNINRMVNSLGSTLLFFLLLFLSFCYVSFLHLEVKSLQSFIVSDYGH